MTENKSSKCFESFKTWLKAARNREMPLFTEPFDQKCSEDIQNFMKQTAIAIDKDHNRLPMYIFNGTNNNPVFNRLPTQPVPVMYAVMTNGEHFNIGHTRNAHLDSWQKIRFHIGRLMPRQNE